MRRISVLAALLVLLVGAWSEANAQNAAKAVPPSIPTVALNNVARHGFFYAGGKYVGELGADKESTMGGAMYVEVMVPKQIRSPYPIVLLHGAGQTGVDWLQTPDGRPGWAYNFLDMGYVVYLQDFPARGRSQYVPGVDGTAGQLNLNIRTAPNLEETFTASAGRNANFPNARKHTQWPGTGRIGDKVFDDFAKTQVQFLAGGRQETLTRDANIALLDMINTPVILLTHSQGGSFGWLVADARPKLVKAIVTVEPAAPPIKGVDTAKLTYNDGGGLSWGVANNPITYAPAITAATELQTVLEGKADEAGKVPCYLQREPARKLANLQTIPVLFLNGEGGYHRVYDHCLAKWLTQAGVKTEYVEMEKAGMPGNGHMMMLEKNSAGIAKYIGTWLGRNAKPSSGERASRAMPSKAIPTFSTEDVARKGFFFAGGTYWGDAGRQVMRGAMYTEVWVPRQVRHAEPIVLFHGNGQTGVDWLQTPDGRAGWAYHLVDQGYVVYMVDYPTRGRSAYVPLPGPDGKTPIDGNLNIRTALELERIWTNGRERGDFPLKMNHTQWPGTGKMGDPIFDSFIKTQVQSAGATGTLTVPAGIALLDMINSPVILFTHSQGGGFGFEITEARPKLVKAMVTVEPGGPQFGGADTAKVTPGPRNPNSWGLTNARYEYSPPANAPSDLNVVLEEKSERPDEVRCWMQAEPARTLARWQNIPVLAMSANGTYHRVYDPCIPKFLEQAGVKAEFVRLETVGISGNSHMMMLEKNSDDIIKFVVSWLQKNVNGT
ncbi:MAG TPA: alpha/beta fold hydrolase [Vicinamibacterales bacterium]|nr:alpha/beta fold hydrolase [Vicinamibacterales bacterium]